MDIVLYMRYSSDRQNEQSIEGQERICTAFCKAQGYNIVNKYIDRATSAYHDSAKRLEFQRMINDSEKHQWQGIVVYKLDRFARNRYDSAVYKARLKKNGVRVISATENISDNPEGVLLESVLEGMAEFYSKELSQKVSRGMTETALKCNSCGGHIPLGYKIENKKFVIEPITAEYVKTAFKMYADGYSIAEIYNIFNDRGYKTSKGKDFNKNSFRGMFKNEKYIGVYKYKDIRIENGIPAIIDMETWNKVQEKLKENAQAPARSTALVDYVLSQKLFCGHCGRNMNGESGYGNNGECYHYYACSGRKHHRDCKKKNIKKDYIERVVAEETMKLLNPETIEYLAEETVRANRAEIKKNTLLPILQQKINDIEKSINRLLKLVEDGAESSTLSKRLSDLEKQKVSIQRQLLKEQHSVVLLDKKQIIFWLSRFVDGDINDSEYRRHLIDLLVNCVYIYDDPDGGTTIDIAYNITPEKHSKLTLSDIEKSKKNSTFSLSGPPKKSCFYSSFFHYVYFLSALKN